MPKTVGVPHSKAMRRIIRLLTTSGIAIDSLEAALGFSFLEAVVLLDAVGAVVLLGAVFLGVGLLVAGSGWGLADFLRF